MKIQILGGGNNQVNGIRRAKQKGHQVVLVDYYKNPPGKAFASVHEAASTFDVVKNLEIAQKHQIDGVMTMGTDQPVYTVSRIAQALNLPAFLDPETAMAVTNKAVMKEKLAAARIRTVPYVYLDKKITSQALDKELSEFSYPVVLKPLDSQGQRGVYKLNSSQEVFASLPQTLSYSRKDKALLESYYDSDEITVSAWAQEGMVNILTVTDRLTFESGKNIGICYAHQSPSKHHGRLAEITTLIEKIAQVFGIRSGPIYVQLLVGEKGILVNEIACRIGGAYEEIFIPYLTGFDIVDQVIDYSLGLSKPFIKMKLDCSPKYLSVQLFFARPGTIKAISPIEALLKLPGLISAGLNVKVGQKLSDIDNATARAGYFIVAQDSKKALDQAVERAYDLLSIENEDGKNLVIKPDQYETFNTAKNT
ncbi:ATP-grasp domain-containing protein [Eubacteriaceae bacterium ES2]|nr:ATP-grasp domain-containing protein [Eubacteriaceae bacterium ES2]